MPRDPQRERERRLPLTPLDHGEEGTGTPDSARHVLRRNVGVVLEVGNQVGINAPWHDCDYSQTAKYRQVKSTGDEKESSCVAKFTSDKDLQFSGSEICGITQPVRVTPYGRFRQKLAELLRTRGSKHALAHYCDRSDSWVSNLLVPRSEEPRPSIDDLDNIARFFDISLGELLGAAKFGELSGREQRMIHALRNLPEPLQLHAVALVEAASLANLPRRHVKESA